MKKFLNDMDLTWEIYIATLQQYTHFVNASEFCNRDISYPVSLFRWYIFPLLEQSGCDFRIESYGYLGEITLSSGKKKFFLGSSLGLNDSVVATIFQDKIYTNYVLRSHGFSVPHDMSIFPVCNQFVSTHNTIDSLRPFAAEVGFPLVVKPVKGSLGQGVDVLYTMQDLEAFVSQYHSSAALQQEIWMGQKFVVGDEYRVLYLDGEILGVYRRIGPTIIGDGASTISLLVSQNNSVADYDRSLGYIHKIGYNPDDVLPLGKKISVLPVANISAGGKTELVEFSQKDSQFVHSIAEVFGARFFGLDIISSGAIHEGTILEINGQPGIKGFCVHDKNFGESFARKVWAAVKG